MIEEKLKQIVERECKYADRDGSSAFSTCDYSNWDKDIWRHREVIINSIRNRGYNVSVSVKWGVTDIVTTKKIDYV
jgi:hypothetical protein